MIDAPVIDLHVHYYTDEYIDAVKASKHIDTYRRGDGRLVARWRSGVALTVGFFNETPLAVARLAYSGAFERWPRIRWVFSHLGGTLPMLVGRLDSYWRQFEDCREHAPRPPSEYLPDLVFDTASKSRAALGCAAEALGTDRLVFGTDYPHIPGGSGPYLEALEVLDLDPDELTELLGGRARHLLAGRRI